MILTPRQEEGLKVAIARFKAGEKYTVISGYAGSGKSTLVKFIVQSLPGIDPEKDVGYACYTGKAAQVLIDKGNKNAITAHKLLYKARQMSNGRYKFEPRANLDFKVIILDECSMLPMNMVKQLLSHQVYVIFCGDPGQLPPIDKDQANTLLDHPHVFLDTIMRQALDSGIIQLSMKIRNGEPITGFKSDDALVLPPSEFTEDMLLWGDITLCATNATRINLNTITRRLLGRDQSYIAPGEKVINLHNEWDILSNNENALTNGCIGYLENCYESYVPVPYQLKMSVRNVPIVSAEFATEKGDNFGRLDLDKKCLITGEPTLDPKQKYVITHSKKYGFPLPCEFTYGYCATTWKAQGSEWDKVLGLEEGHPWNKEDHKKYLYTLATRASKKLVLITKN